MRGSEDYFSRRHIYTLEALRTVGPDVLHTDALPGHAKAALLKVEIVEDDSDSVHTIEARDLFEPGHFGDTGPIPRQGRLRSAVFDLHFPGCRQPRPLQIRLPNVLKLRRHCDLQLVDGLVSRFRDGEP